MVKSTNKRINVLVSKDTCEYLQTICDIYNDELLKVPYSKKQIVYPYNLKKINLSSLYQVAIGNLILQIDKIFDTKKSKEYNHKKIFDFLSGLKN